MNKRDFIMGGAALAGAATLAPRTPARAADGALDSRPPDPLLMEDLVTANHILVDQDVLDGFGHVSARHDKRPDRFLLSRSLAPALVTQADIIEFDLDGVPVNGDRRTLYAERFIHSEIYRARPDVKAVVHSHSPSVLPFGVTSAPLRPLYHMAGFLGQGAPVFEPRTALGDDSDLLIGSPAVGKALAQALGRSTIVLIRGHGWVATGSSVRTAVMHAVYTEIDAKAESDALKLGPVKFLNPAEAARTAATNDRLVDRPWEIWRAKVMGR